MDSTIAAGVIGTQEHQHEMKMVSEGVIARRSFLGLSSDKCSAERKSLPNMEDKWSASPGQSNEGGRLSIDQHRQGMQPRTSTGKRFELTAVKYD